MRPPATPCSVYRAHAAWTVALRQICRTRAVILGYHGVAQCSRREDEFMLQVPPIKFRAQLELMRSAGFRFVTVAQLARTATAGGPPAGLAAVSFDDGMRNVFTTAFPILAELGITATVYAPTRWLGGRNPWLGRNGDNVIMTADELRRLAAAGWELGSHTVNHADLSELDYEGCLEEISESSRVLTEIGGEQVETLAYPFGRWSPQAAAAARDAGLVAAVKTGSGTWKGYDLPRAMIGSADPFPVILLRLTDRCHRLLRSTPLRMARIATETVRG